MESNAIYTTSDAGLSRFFGKIYGLVGMGVGLSAVISYLMLFPLSHVFVNILMNYSWVYMAALFLEFGLVFLASGAARRNTPAALPLFLVYSALNGFTLLSSFNTRKPLFSKLSLALPSFSLLWPLSELALSEIYQAWLSSLWQP